MKNLTLSKRKYIVFINHKVPGGNCSQLIHSNMEMCWIIIIKKDYSTIGRVKFSNTFVSDAGMFKNDFCE